MHRINHSKSFLLFLFAGYIVASTFGWSQAEAIIKGKVVSENGTPIKNASVKIGNTDSRTNSSGIFILRNNEFPVQITVSHPLFSEYRDIVVPERWKDTLRIFVTMTNKEKELNEVTITADQIFWVYPRKQANVIDFILQPDNGIVLCCSDENNYFVRGLNSQGEKLYETPIRRHPRKLFRDCMETIHLVYSDSIYETSLVNNSIGMFQPKATLGIFNLLQSCVYKDSENLVKYTYSKQDQCIEYSAINLQTKLTRILYIGESRARNRQLQEYAKDTENAEDKLFHTVPPPPPMATTAKNPSHLKDSPGDLAALKDARDRWNNKKFYDLILIQPTYIPMFELNDSLIIFDHLNDSAVVFTKAGVLVRSFPIYYHYFPGWKNELITNLEKTKIYARYQSEGLTTLREINPTNGKMEKSINLEKHVFPEHIQIHGDFIYYIYKDYLDQSMHYIFKQHLE